MRIRSVFLCSIVFSSLTFAQTATIKPVVVKRMKPDELTAKSVIARTISHHQIKKSGATSVSQVLQYLGNVQLTNMSGDNSQITMSLRGFGANASSNSLFLINGIPITNPDLAPPNINVIPIDDIETVTVIPGSESVLYGDQAVGGIVNINTHRLRKDNIRIACATGSYNQRDCQFSFSHKQNLLRTYIHVGADFTENYRDHNNYDLQNISGQFDYNRNTSNTSVDYQGNNEYIEFPGALTAAQVRQDRRQASNDRDFFRNQNLFVHLYHRKQVFSDWKLHFDLSGRGMNGHGVLFSPFSQTRQTIFVKPSVKGHYQQAKIDTGANFQADDYSLNSAFGPDNNKQQKFGAYIFSNIAISHHNDLSLGVRGAEMTARINSTNENTFINRAFVTTVGLTHRFMPDIKGYARRAGSFRFPKADENASTARGIDGLRTQRGVSYEAGIQYDRAPALVTANVYQLNLKDEIAFDPTQTVQQPFGSNENLSPTVRRGVSLSGKYNIDQRLSVDSQINLVDARFQNGIYKNNRIPLVSEATIHAGADYHFNDHWHLYIEGLYTGNQYPANDFGNVSGRNGGYTLVNSNLGYQSKHISLTFRVNNIFDRPYYIYTVYQTSSQSETFYPAAERNYSLNLVWNMA